MNKQQIICAIENCIEERYPDWTIGVTDRPNERKQEHEQDGKDISYWRHWNASTESVAREIEYHFLDKGCMGAGGGPGNADYVYIF